MLSLLNHCLDQHSRFRGKIQLKADIVEFRVRFCERTMTTAIVKRLFCLTGLLVTSLFPGLAKSQGGKRFFTTSDLTYGWKLDKNKVKSPQTAEPECVLASPIEKMVETATTDDIVKRATRLHVESVKTALRTQLKGQHDHKDRLESSDRNNADAVGPLGPAWTDPATGLMWDSRDNGTDITWDDAVQYCAKLELGSYRNWHLASLDELLSIYDSSTGVTSNLKSAAHVRGPIRITGWTWSSSPGTSPRQAWSLSFFGVAKPRDGFGGSFKYNMRALCVRSQEHA